MQVAGTLIEGRIRCRCCYKGEGVDGGRGGSLRMAMDAQ